MSWIGDFWKTALGKKAVMAVTGLVLFGFVLTHMAGNLKLYLPVYADGPHAGMHPLNVYGEWLREIGTPALPHGGALWIARAVLLVSLVLHVWAALAVTLASRRARPVAYRSARYLQADYATRTMRWGGVIVLLFVLYHLAHLTLGSAHHDFIPGDVFHNVVTGFRVPWVAGLYILANLALGLHLYHGLWSLFQTLGLAHPNFNPWRRTFAALFAAVICLGNISFPVAVLTGLVS